MYVGRRVIDVHGHISSPPAVRAYAFNLSLVGDTSSRLALGEAEVVPAMNRHLKMMDERGIDFQLLSARPIAMMHYEAPPVVAHWTRVTNDLIAQQCALKPDRFAGIAQLPQNVSRDTSNCIEELERCHALGFVGATVNPDPGADRKAPGLDDAYWHPLYKRAVELQMTLIIHPSVTKDPRLAVVPSAYQYNSLTEETLATLLFENTDVLQRFPGLKVVVCHCGGALRRLPYKGDPVDAVEAGRGQGQFYCDSGETAGGQVGMPVVPGEKVKRDLGDSLYFDTCAYDPHFLATAIKQRGASRMLFGTEVPGTSSDLLNPVTGRPADDVLALLESFDFLTPDEILQMVHHGPRKVFPRLDALGLLA